MPVMTKEELLAKLRELAELDDNEFTHKEADAALLEFINDAEISAAFEEIRKWYA